MRNESYTPGGEGEEFTGRLFRVYTRSHFLDYVRAATFASDEYPGGKLNHYGLVCENHVIDVISVGEPTVSLLRDARRHQVREDFRVH